MMIFLCISRHLDFYGCIVPDQTVNEKCIGTFGVCSGRAKRLFNIPSYKVKVTHDDEVIEDEFVYGMVTNSRSVGGFRNLVGKQVGFDDGVFEVTLIKTPKNPIELQEIIAALMIQQMDSKYMYTFKSGRIMFESIEEIPWTLDGNSAVNMMRL